VNKEAVMTSIRSLYMAATVALSGLVLAGPAAAEQAITPEGLGTVQGILEHCARVDGANADKYDKILALLVKDVPPSEVGGARAKPEFTREREGAAGNFDKISAAEASKRCRETLTALKIK